MENPAQWKLQTLVFDNKMQYNLQQQHHAAQFIALVGHHLITQKEDDSNTNMEFQTVGNILIGNPLENGLRLGMRLIDFKLEIIDSNNKVLSGISLNSKTKLQIFYELKEELTKYGVDVSKLSYDLHYEIPDYNILDDKIFSVDEKYLRENAFYRHNANLVLKDILSEYDNSEEIKIWPHHFDTGSIINIEKNAKGEPTNSIGLGFAISDSMVNEPYYYLNFWSEQQLEISSKINSPGQGKWMFPQWQGAVLPISVINSGKSPESQKLIAYEFLREGIEKIKELLNN